MKPELSTETIVTIVDAVQELTGKRGTQIHVNQPRICDHCKDADKEAFPYHVYDSNGELWEDLCNECFDELGCAYPDDGDPPEPDTIVIFDNPDDQLMVCPTCGMCMEWEDCWNGCEDGFFSMYEEDPLWYDEDDTEVCEICKGQGGYWVCPNAENHAVDKISNG